RGDLSGAPTFRELLRRTREAALGAYAHQELPFELLVERLQPERDLSRTPLFQVAFAMQNADAGSLELEGLKLKPLSVENHTSKFDLGLHMAESGRVLTGTVEYSTDLFDASTIERLVGHYRELLEAVVADAGRCVADLPLLTAPERRQLLSDFNDTEADYPQGLRLHQTFEEQAARTPDATAFVFGEERVTYSELNRRANQLAHHLQACGVGPETCVAVCMERSAEMIVGLFGILKAGGAYVPLDLAYPHERLAHILEKTQAPVLLTRREHAALFPAYEGRQVWLDADWETIAAGPEENPQSRVEPENLAYVIFTSGSTGQPKGVAIPHAPAVALLQWAAEVFSKEELSGVLASTSICFDLSVFELFLPLSLGGKFILAENVLHLPALAAAEEVRLVNTVPSAMRELLRLGALPASVVTVNLAGEALARPLAEAVYALPQVERLYNLYGPSEDTTYSTWALVERGGAGVTIGRPVANSRAYVLDPRMRPVPIGVAGELYMGGDGLARGYLKRPAATAERFVPDPFGGDGGRLYHTGDLARYLPDGQIEYLGRGDQQVKIRGFRIEPGEVEAALLTHPSVKEALVLVDDTGADKRLVAYVVPAQPEALTPSDLQFHLKSKLPPYMVPGAYVVLERMPLTPNGKVDRAAARREGRAAVSQAAFEAPRTELERTVASVWKELLRVERVGVNDNFFDLGGHSLLAVQAHERLAALVGRELSLVDMFQYPTVSSLAEYLRQGEPARPAFEESGERATAQRQSARRRRQQRDKQLNAG
ncbi:MAG TPA: amino acid adenylation domain-containing protein, partial [Pyrinomonadaceae bacterium]